MCTEPSPASQTDIDKSFTFPRSHSNALRFSTGACLSSSMRENLQYNHNLCTHWLLCIFISTWLTPGQMSCPEQGRAEQAKMLRWCRTASSREEELSLQATACDPSCGESSASLTSLLQRLPDRDRQAAEQPRPELHGHLEAQDGRQAVATCWWGPLFSS